MIAMRKRWARENGISMGLAGIGRRRDRRRRELRGQCAVKVAA
jgi:hypothetical protein